MDIVTEMVNFASGDHQTPGYLARPDDLGPYPGIVVIQEWWGLVPHIKDVTERFARKGFIALAPDLYYGKASTEPNEAQKLAMAMDRKRAVDEIRQAARYVSTIPATTPKKAGIVGFCMGGSLALSVAAEDGDLGAVVAFYGKPLDPADIDRVKAPVFGIYAEEDHGIPMDAVRIFEKSLEANHVPHQIILYPGTHHAFFNDTRPETYNPEAAQDAWQKTLDWFGQYLK